jgi:NADPH:quinone reductase-like Zn-dependent oxidoreductase
MTASATMKAARIHRFGPPQVLMVEDIPRPEPGAGEVLVRVHAAGVGPWDAWIRAGKSALPQPLPLTLGSDLSGTVEAVGPGMTAFAQGDAVFGVTNPHFIGAYAEFAVASAGMVSRKPDTLSDIDAASVPVVAVTAQQALFEEARLTRGQAVLIHGAAGNVGSYAVQLARRAGLRVIATAGAQDKADVLSLGADQVIDYRIERFEDKAGTVDAVLDLVGGEVQTRSFSVLKPGGALVSAVAPPDQDLAKRHGVDARFFLVEVTTQRLDRIASLVAAGELRTAIGTVLPLAAARDAHEMLEGTRPHPKGKIVLRIPG